MTGRQAACPTTDFASVPHPAAQLVLCLGTPHAERRTPNPALPPSQSRGQFLGAGLADGVSGGDEGDHGVVSDQGDLIADLAHPSSFRLHPFPPDHSVSDAEPRVFHKQVLALVSPAPRPTSRAPIRPSALCPLPSALAHLIADPLGSGSTSMPADAVLHYKIGEQNRFAGDHNCY